MVWPLMALLGLILFAPSVQAVGEGTSLSAAIEAVEETDAEIATLTEELKKVRTPLERRQLQAQIEELQQKQEDQLLELEKLIGPLPPTIPSEQPIPLEQELKAREKRHETTLESNVEKRLPSP